LPFLVDLSPEDRQELFKAGPKSRAFLDLALATAQEHPEVLPRAFDLDAFAEDVALFGDLDRPYVALRDLLRQMEDTRIAVGAEAMEAARAVYHYVQGYPGSDALTEAYQGLRVRFRARPARTNGDPDAPTT
ncbi:MAG TPA: hypothetical protein VGB53_05400, partial [Rubricoccaceae bacterium]